MITHVWLHYTAQSCDFYYNVQPGPTTETCNFTTAEYFVLKCQVSSNLSHNFHIDWHYSSSLPDINSTINSSISQLHLEYEIKSESFRPINNTVISTLTTTVFNATANGFYWCSVNLTKPNNVQTSNPSTILRIWHQNECNNNQECNDILDLYEQSTSAHAIRCADQDIDICVTEAQTCSQVSMSGISTSAINSESSTTAISAPNITTPSIVSLSLSSTSTTTRSSSNPAPKNNVWIAIGALTGCVILIFYCIVGVIIMCMMYRRRQGEYKLNDLHVIMSPFDNIHMDISTSMPQEKESNKNRVSDIFFEANVSYECTHTAISQTNENIYAAIQ